MSSNDIVINLRLGGDCNAYLSRVGEGTPLQDEDYYGSYICTGDFIGYHISLVNGASITESNLLKKNLEIFYHAVIETYAAVICNVGFVKGTNNIDN